MTNKLKLYVWEGVLTSYTDGIMFALAHSVKEARVLIQTKEECTKECFGAVRQDLARRPRIITKPEAFIIWGGD